MPLPVRVRLGTRASLLARWQADWVAGRLRESGVEVELVPITTQGDAQQTGPIGAIGTQGVFTKELQRALLEGQIDLAVHSLKDLPTEPVPGLALAAVPPRGPVGDCLVSVRYRGFAELPERAVVGTGSLRRQAQLLAARPDLLLRDVRGNVDTRLRKLADGQYDALILAEAGLKRLGLDQHVTEVLPKSVVLPAVGQGALGIEARARDEATLRVLAHLDDRATHAAVTAERTLLAQLRGGCLAPIAAWAREDDAGQLRLDARVVARDGSRLLETFGVSGLDEAELLGQTAAQQLLADGAAELIAASRG